ncbi:efflux RND transporter periplasmic adaptor subunit [Mucisphaera calidilacus]|uniref:Cobalt-zinc-cadmium resistance protein CzcB n=1 Tax=Mucisphaera calidilacus TaxID=2527982 RepID=A0A518BYC3_9BACT|nr:efflux RND transporter periplasmic adaptor subunit [Mucisphaera calidilacus]QDU71958.1 Cobalt-zinc-cadmium resistance protein CzcB [Mucisphaera calidilacus]
MADKKTNRRWWIGAAVAAAIAILAWSIFSPGPAGAASVSGQAPEDWYAVERQSLDLTVVATGELESRERIELKCQVNGRTAISYIIDEGSKVEEGDILVQLDDQDISNRLESQQLDVENARLSLTTAERELEIQRNEAESSQKDAEVKLDSARLELAKWEQGDVPTKLRELQLNLDKAQRKVVRTERDLELSTQLYEQKFISLNEKEDDEIAEIEAKEALETSKLAIDIYKQYDFVKQKQEKETAVEQAQANLQRVIAKNESNLARHESDVRSKKRTLELREKALTETQEQLENTIIKAPSPGLVVYATSIGPEWRRGDPLSVGREVRNNESLIYLPDITQMAAVLKVHEALLPQVTVGQRAIIRIDARPNSPVEGQVTTIGVTADSGGWLNPDLREYKVRIDLPDGFDLSLKPAMRLSGEIFTGRVEDVLAVPVQAVNVIGDQAYVYLPASGSRIRQQPVTMGKASETMVEIVEGLNENDRVLLRKPRPGELDKSADTTDDA